MLPRSVQRLLKSFILAMVVAGLALVPLWQSIGHASDVEHSLMLVQEADARSGQDHFSANEAGHHVAADHAHEMPLLRLASLPQVAMSRERWVFPTPVISDGTEPYDPEQPPRRI
jgi:hypothetical protein